MNQNTFSFPLHRILVPLDASENSLTALDTAAELAAVLDAELEGLFVEDINLLQLCDFPFAREVSFLGPSFRRIDRAETERRNSDLQLGPRAGPVLQFWRKASTHPTSVRRI